ncbi:MAG: nickel pincer cofactor biosynthesis protein LarB [Anaerolineae bacterium]
MNVSDTGNRLQQTAAVRPDFERAQRKGVPEVILASTKTTEQCLAIIEAFLARNNRAILSRVPVALEAELKLRYDSGLEWYPVSRVAIVRSNSQRTARSGGRVGVITAGTSDQPRAEEAALVCQEMGCDVHPVYDVGVAGIHRLFGPLDELVKVHHVDVVIVAAGMDGALPSVVSGLVDVPVIGLPTSVGYGMGGEGQAALMAMLQTCSPGLAVVNIDNGVGAGAMAGIIANRCALARASSQEG